MKIVSVLILNTFFAINSYAFNYGFFVQSNKDVIVINDDNAAEVSDIFYNGDDKIKACYFGDLNLIVEGINRGVFDSVWGDWGMGNAKALNKQLTFSYLEVGTETKHILDACF